MTDPFASLEDDLTEPRADYGHCTACGARCLEPPVEWFHARYHQGCKPQGRCAGCHEPIGPLEPVKHHGEDLALVHDRKDCAEAEERQRKVRLARAAAAADREQAQRLAERFQRSGTAFVAGMLATARAVPSPVICVTLPRLVADLTQSLTNSHPKAYKRMRGSQHGTVCFRDAPGSITVVGYRDGDLEALRGRISGVRRIYVSAAAHHKYPDCERQLRQALSINEIITEGEVSPPPGREERNA